MNTKAKGKIAFTVPGPPVGYYAEGKHPNWSRRKRYVAYKRLVQQCAVAAGIPGGTLQADEHSPLYIHTVAYFQDGHHADPENVRKGIADALFYRQQGKGGGDKFTGGSFEPPLYDRKNPRVEVVIEPAEVW